MGREEMPSVFGDLLREYREQAGWSLRELVLKLGEQGYNITQSALSNYELGKRRPGGDFFAYLKICFNWSDAQLEDALSSLSTDYLDELFSQYYKAIF